MEIRMYYPYDTATKYFSDKEKEQLQKFLELDVKTGIIYTNKNNEKRQVLKIEYPQGLITKETTYAPVLYKGGIKAYHTPRTTLPVDIKKASITYMEDRDMFKCDSDEWLEFVGDIKVKTQKAKHTKSMPELDAAAKAKKEMAKNTPPKPFNEKPKNELEGIEKEKWISPTKKKKK